MPDYFDYVAEAIFKAFEKSWSKLGMGVNIGLSLFSLAVYSLTNLPTIDLVRAAILVLVVFLFTLCIYIVWELQAYFPDIHVRKRNTLEGAEIVITNDEVVDLTDLEVEIFSSAWVSKSSGRLPIPLDPSNRFFNIEGDTRVAYGGGVKTVLIGSGKNETATFHFKIEELDTGFEYYDGADRSIYDVVIKIKGKIKERPIFPRKVAGVLKYMRAPQEFPMYINGRHEIVKQVYSTMEWETPDYKGQTNVKENETKVRISKR